MRLLPAFVLASVLTVGSLYVSVSVEVEQECETSADGEVTCTDAPAASNSTADDDSDCVDKDEKCEGWNNARQCYGDNANFMLRECPKSCGVCGKSEQYDDPGPTEDMCSNILDVESCNKKYDKCDDRLTFATCKDVCGMCIKVDTDYGLKQNVMEGTEVEPLLRAWNKRTVKYIRDFRMDFNNNGKTARKCESRNEQCLMWALQGDCKNNPEFMNQVCAPQCQTCHLLNLDENCPREDFAADAYDPGDLNRVFEAIVAEGSEYTKNGHTVHSRPTADADAPWVITLDGFVSDEEIERMMFFSKGVKWEQKNSMQNDDLKMKWMPQFLKDVFPPHIKDRQAPKTATCQGECSEDDLMAKLTDRIATMTDTPMEYSEPLEFYKYEKGSKFDMHHDTVEHQVDRACGHRIVSVVMYLDDVEMGGDHHFPELDLTIRPKKGMALVYSNTLNERPNQWDERTLHKETPVVVKTGMRTARVFVHQRDFMESYNMACHYFHLGQVQV